MTAALAPDEFEEALREHVKDYHHQHPFHRRMNTGQSSREEIRGWVANRFYYQSNIPRKDGAILSSCPDREIRRRWVQRIIDHDGTSEGTGGIEAWLRLGEAVGLTRAEVEDGRHLLPGVRFAVDDRAAPKRKAVVVPRMYPSMISRVLRGFPCQFLLMKLNRRCSTGFHFEHPAG